MGKKIKVTAHQLNGMPVKGKTSACKTQLLASYGNPCKNNIICYLLKWRVS